MLLGFISLLLTIGTRFIAKICIPAELGSTMLPCKRGYKDGGGYGGGGGDDGDDGDDGGDGRRKLLSYAEERILRRVLAAQAGGDYCSKSVSHHHDFYYVDSIFETAILFTAEKFENVEGVC